jgi:hypothetical protein
MVDRPDINPLLLFVDRRNRHPLMKPECAQMVRMLVMRSDSGTVFEL